MRPLGVLFQESSPDRPVTESEFANTFRHPKVGPTPKTFTVAPTTEGIKNNLRELISYIPPPVTGALVENGKLTHVTV
jgi:hypothetical protein